MSLASVFANCFSPGTKRSQTDQNAHFVDAVKIKDESNKTDSMAPKALEESSRPPYLHSMIAGGLGGTIGDLFLHSLDTVKTRQQGDPYYPPKYSSMTSSYFMIMRQEGIRRGLYGGWLPALLGSFPGTVIFFGTYESCKRNMLEYGTSPYLTYLMSGFIADLAASFVYVPSEVLKTRLQLQGRYNNPFFRSGYNYKSTLDATRTIVRKEGISALFYGYKATLFRDIPYSALQFLFYEQGQAWARKFKQSKEIGLSLEIITGATSGGLAGVITCPLDVVKTRMQTQINIGSEILLKIPSKFPQAQNLSGPHALSQTNNRSLSTSACISRNASVNLDTSSVITGLRIIYNSEGLPGLFRGAGPRVVWTGIQSGCMFFMYQKILRLLE